MTEREDEADCSSVLAFDFERSPETSSPITVASSLTRKSSPINAIGFSDTSDSTCNRLSSPVTLQSNASGKICLLYVVPFTKEMSDV